MPGYSHGSEMLKIKSQQINGPMVIKDCFINKFLSLKHFHQLKNMVKEICFAWQFLKLFTTFQLPPQFSFRKELLFSHSSFWTWSLLTFSEPTLPPVYLRLTQLRTSIIKAQSMPTGHWEVSCRDVDPPTPSGCATSITSVWTSHPQNPFRWAPWEKKTLRKPFWCQSSKRDARGNSGLEPAPVNEAFWLPGNFHYRVKRIICVLSLLATEIILSQNKTKDYWFWLP